MKIIKFIKSVSQDVGNAVEQEMKELIIVMSAMMIIYFLLILLQYQKIVIKNVINIIILITIIYTNVSMHALLILEN